MIFLSPALLLLLLRSYVNAGVRVRLRLRARPPATRRRLRRPPPQVAAVSHRPPIAGDRPRLRFFFSFTYERARAYPCCRLNCVASGLRCWPPPACRRGLHSRLPPSPELRQFSTPAPLRFSLFLVRSSRPRTCLRRPSPHSTAARPPSTTSSTTSCQFAVVYRCRRRRSPVARVRSVQLLVTLHASPPSAYVHAPPVVVRSPRRRRRRCAEKMRMAEA
jgi:hypothetical protein